MRLVAVVPISCAPAAVDSAKMRAPDSAPALKNSIDNKPMLESDKLHSNDEPLTKLIQGIAAEKRIVPMVFIGVVNECDSTKAANG